MPARFLPLRALSATFCLLLLGGCTATGGAASPPNGVFPGESPPAAAPGAAAVPSLVKLSEADQATATSVAVGRDGTVHALYRGKTEAGGWRNQLYHRVSRDGGVSWSAPVVISEDQPERHAGLGRLATDLSGRVYAVWKSSALDTDEPSGGLLEGTLVARVLEAGAWGQTLTLGEPGRAVSFFAAPGPSGVLSVVWNEVQAAEDSFLTSTLNAGLVLRAELDGPRARTPDVLLRSTQQGYSFDGYTGLSGVVDGSGAVRFVAQKTLAGAYGADPALVYFDGRRETTLFAIAEHYSAGTRAHGLPPQLLLDAEGTPHVVTLSERSGPPTLLDVTEGGAVVLHATETGGAIAAFQAVQSPIGGIGVLASVKPANGLTDTFDLFAQAYRAGAWNGPIRLTRNALGDAITGGQLWDGTATASVRYHSAQAAGAFDGEGRLNVVFVNQRSHTTTDANRVDFGSRAYDQGFGAGLSVPEVFFTRLP